MGDVINDFSFGFDYFGNALLLADKISGCGGRNERQRRFLSNLSEIMAQIMIDLIKNIVSIIVKLFEVFPQWWKQRQEKNVAKLRKEKMELMLERAMIRKKLDKAETQEERDELNKIYFNINNRIRYINILLHEN